jgi:hypothetical protein
VLNKLFFVLLKSLAPTGEIPQNVRQEYYKQWNEYRATLDKK